MNQTHYHQTIKQLRAIEVIEKIKSKHNDSIDFDYILERIVFLNSRFENSFDFYKSILGIQLNRFEKKFIRNLIGTDHLDFDEFVNNHSDIIIFRKKDISDGYYAIFNDSYKSA